MGLRLRNGHLGNPKIKVKNAKLRNPDLVGMGVLVVGSFSISRILYLLDVYYTGWSVRCQVNFNHRFHRFSQILWIELPAEGTEDTENTGAQEHKGTRA